VCHAEPIAACIDRVCTCGVTLVRIIWGNHETPRFVEDQYDRIAIGMTFAEVEQIFGCPPGNYAKKRDLLPINMSAYGEEKRTSRAMYREWAADTTDPLYTDGNGPNRRDALAVRVWFDDGGKVIDKCRMGYAYTQSSFFQKILRSVGL
jgi:hypothetical protein